MIHRDWECGINTIAQADLSDIKNVFLDQYWKFIWNELFVRIKKRDLITHDHKIDVDVYSESWTSLRLRRSKNIIAQKAYEDDPMYEIFDALSSYGAKLMVTENQFHYHLHGAIGLVPRPGKMRFDLYCVEARDRAVAEKINLHTSDGRSSVLFMGSAHDVPKYLNDSWNIEVITSNEIVSITKEISPSIKLRWAHLYQQQGAANRITEGEMN